jgi:DNA-binding HxlR family transcriptional regulator
MSEGESCGCCSSSTITSETDHTCYCPVDGIIDTISKKHALPIVSVLGSNGPTRYNELEEVLGVTSSSLLSTRLNELMSEGLIERQSFDEIPPRVEYSLSSDGEELEQRLRPLLEWADEA